MEHVLRVGHLPAAVSASERPLAAWLAVLLLALAPVGAVAQTSPAAATASPRPLKWYTTASTSTNHVAALQISQMLNSAAPSVRITIHDSTGALENVRRLQDGSANLVNMVTDLAYDAHNGTGDYKGKAFPKIRNLLTMQGLTYAILVRKDTGITSLEQLTGKKFSPGFTGSSTAISIMNELQALGIKPDYALLSLRDAIDAVKDGRTVGFGKGAAVPDASILEIATDRPIRLLQPTPAQLNDFVKKVPGTTIVTQKIKAGTYAGIDTDQQYSQLGFGIFIATSSDLPQEVGYRLAKETVARWSVTMQSVKGYADSQPLELTVSGSTVPLAAGTVQLLKERRVTLPAHLVPPEYKDVKK